MNFEQFNLSEPVLAGIRDAGFTEPTPVQVESLKFSLSGRDVTVQSQTGTGKTAAFLISIFELLTQSEQYKGRKALIVAPTRELAVQIEDEANLLGKHVGLSVASFYGGVGYGKQEEALEKGVDIYVATPGRLLDFSQSKKIDLREIGICVIDEADRLFDMGFYPDIRRIMKAMVPRKERLTMLYSATLSVRVLNIAWEYMNDPAEVEIEPEHLTVDKVAQEVLHVSRDEKMRVLLGLLKREDPQTCLVFANTKIATEKIAKRLELNNFSARFIMGDLPQRKRLQIIEGMKSGKTRILVATDVAARGLHIDDLDLVVNYDVPEDPESYVHRIGRTARAGRSGRAYMLACERYVYGLDPIESLIGMKIPVGKVSDELLVEDRSEGVHIRTGDSRSGGSDRRRDSGGRGGRSDGRDRSRGDRSQRDRPKRERSRGERSHSDRPKDDRNRAAHVHEAHGPSGGKGGASDHPDSKSHASRAPGGDRDRGESRKRRERTPRRKVPVQARGGGETVGGAPNREDSLDSRIEYYKRKYGEDFVPGDVSEQRPQESGAPRETADSKAANQQSGGLVSRLKRLFGRR